MKLVITIDCENKAFDGADSGNELARILRPLPDLFEFESKSTIARRYGANPKRLRRHERQHGWPRQNLPFTRRSLMTQPELDASRYLQNAGRQCPVCHLEVVWHERNRIDALVVSNVRLLVMHCWCRHCRATWVETYRLVGVHWNRSEAEAVAKKTYKGGP